ncbi:flagella synthesis protein FlgN [Lelliottia nimipressuralis]|uniref:Flagellar protein FlgN n=1 Tax=Lelliottia nimipressuralis TaxID=69220 RepID=A0ABD4KFA9_9ENTR|nr:flagellar protein FlgN [Lelliottia nimipressuralis]MBF4180275.1 flagellar protein FlgN [Lelliottia nimipressuralis]
MSNAAQSVRTLIQGMVDDRNHYNQLKTLLTDQRQFLIARNAQALETLNASIFTVYVQLLENSKQRYQLLTRLGIPAGAHGLRTLFTRLPAANQSQLNTLWDSLEQLAAECKTLNDSNGMVLAMQQEVLQNLFNVGEPEKWLYRQV